MSVATLPELMPAEACRETRIPFDRSTAACEASPRPVRAAYVRRRGSSEQGRALEALGHAVEYLVDSRLLNRYARAAEGDQQAVQILMQLSRTVFAECPEVVPLGRRLRGWIEAHVPHRMAGARRSECEPARKGREPAC